MNSFRRLATAAAVSLTLAASLVVAPAATSEAHADSLVFGNSKKSNVGFSAYANNNCKGKRDFVEVGELAHGIGSVGSIEVPANSGGIASPYYIIKRSKKARCWNAPTQVATSVYLKRVKAGSW